MISHFSVVPFHYECRLDGGVGRWGGKVELSTLYEAMIRHNFRLNGVLGNHNEGNCCRYTKLNFPVISRAAIEKLTKWVRVGWKGVDGRAHHNSTYLRKVVISVRWSKFWNLNGIRKCRDYILDGWLDKLHPWETSQFKAARQAARVAQAFSPSTPPSNFFIRTKSRNSFFTL